MQKRAKKQGYTFPYLVDEGQQVYPKFGATKTPHNYVLQKTEKGFVVKYIGAIDDSSRNPKAVKERYLEAAVDALLNDKPIEVKKTKAIGCSIKV
jgi:peroxiredoxin